MSNFSQRAREWSENLFRTEKLKRHAADKREIARRLASAER